MFLAFHLDFVLLIRRISSTSSTLKLKELLRTQLNIIFSPVWNATKAHSFVPSPFYYIPLPPFSSFNSIKFLKIIQRALCLCPFKSPFVLCNVPSASRGLRVKVSNTYFPLRQAHKNLIRRSYFSTCFAIALRALPSAHVKSSQKCVWARSRNCSTEREHP